MAQEYLICNKQELIAIADAVRTKTGNIDTYTVSELPDAIEAIEAGGKTTKTINIDWSGDIELIAWVEYISNNQIVRTTAPLNLGMETIEAEYGIVSFDSDYIEYSSNFTFLGELYRGGKLYIATQDGETLYAISSDYQ